MILTEQEVIGLWDSHVVPVFGKSGINPVVFATLIESAVLAKLKAQEPACSQFQDREGNWKPFINADHERATRDSMAWPVRDLYTHPLPPDDVVRDAARYRFLRSQHQGVEKHKDAEWYDYTEPAPYGFTVFHSPNPDECSLEPVGSVPGELDAAIDAAISRSK